MTCGQNFAHAIFFEKSLEFCLNLVTQKFSKVASNRVHCPPGSSHTVVCCILPGPGVASRHRLTPIMHRIHGSMCTSLMHRAWSKPTTKLYRSSVLACNGRTSYIPQRQSCILRQYRASQTWSIDYISRVNGWTTSTKSHNIDKHEQVDSFPRLQLNYCHSRLRVIE